MVVVVMVVCKQPKEEVVEDGRGVTGADCPLNVSRVVVVKRR